MESLAAVVRVQPWPHHLCASKGYARWRYTRCSLSGHLIRCPAPPHGYAVVWRGALHCMWCRLRARRSWRSRRQRSPSPRASAPGWCARSTASPPRSLRPRCDAHEPPLPAPCPAFCQQRLTSCPPPTGRQNRGDPRWRPLGPPHVPANAPRVHAPAATTAHGPLPAGGAERERRVRAPAAQAVSGRAAAQARHAHGGGGHVQRHAQALPLQRARQVSEWQRAHGAPRTCAVLEWPAAPLAAGWHTPWITCRASPLTRCFPFSLRPAAPSCPSWRRWARTCSTAGAQRFKRSPAVGAPQLSTALHLVAWRCAGRRSCPTWCLSCGSCRPKRPRAAPPLRPRSATPCACCTTGRSWTGSRTAPPVSTHTHALGHGQATGNGSRHLWFLRRRVRACVFRRRHGGHRPRHAGRISSEAG